MKELFVKEIFSYFKSKMFYGALFIYAAISLVCCFYMAGFFELETNNLASLFYFQPNILSFFIPAFAIKIWSEERRTNTIELLLSQPISFFDVVIAKFFACVCLAALLLFMTLPFFVWASFYLNLDYMSVFSSYLACLLSIVAMSGISCVVASFFSGAAFSYICSLFAIWAIFWLGFSANFIDIMYGRIGLNNILYFAVITIFAINTNIYFVKTKLVKNKKLLLFVFLQMLSAMVIIFMANVLFSFYKFDISYSKSFSLSKEASSVIKNYKKPIVIDLYISDFFGVDNNKAEYIQNVVRFIKQVPNATVNVRKIKPFSNEELAAKELDFDFVETQKYNLYSGIAVSSDKKIVAIKSLNPKDANFLELDVIRAIDALNNDKRQTIGIVSAKNQVLRKPYGILKGSDWPFVDELKKAYNVADISENVVEIPAEIDVLLVIDSPSSVLLKYAIDQFLMRGGKVIVVGSDIDFGYENVGMQNEEVKLFEGKFQSVFESNIIKDEKLKKEMLPHFFVSVKEPKLVVVDDNVVGNKNGFNKKDVEFLLKQLDYVVNNANLLKINPKKEIESGFSIKGQVEEKFSGKYLKKMQQIDKDVNKINEQLFVLMQSGIDDLLEQQKVQSLEEQLIEKQEEAKKIAYVIEDKSKAAILFYALINILVFPFFMVVFLALAFNVWRKRYVKI